MAQPFWNQLGDGVKILVGIITIAGVLVGAVLYFSSLNERTSLLEARADRIETQNTQVESSLEIIKEILGQMREDVAVIKNVLQITPNG